MAGRSIGSFRTFSTRKVVAARAWFAALKVKMQRPEALIAYVRQRNKRGDSRHPMRRLSSESP
jgi:hypothetical protein